MIFKHCASLYLLIPQSIFHFMLDISKDVSSPKSNSSKNEIGKLFNSLRRRRLKIQPVNCHFERRNVSSLF